MRLPLLNKLQGQNDAHEFQPVLSEIQDSPGSPLGRWVLWLVMGVFLFFILWACLGEIDVVISARGKLIPDGNLKILQPLETGVVRQILVKEGDYVRKGQSLMLIDPSTTRPQLESYEENLSHLKEETDRLTATAVGGGYQGSDPTQRQLYASSMASLSTQMGAKSEQLQTLEAQRSGIQTQIAQNQTLLKSAKDRENRLAEVKDIIAKDEYQKASDEVNSVQSKLKELKYQSDQIHYQKQQVYQEMGTVRANFQTTTLNDLSEKQKQITQLISSIKETQFKNAQQTLVSPVDGYVNDLFVHTIGGVVTPAEKVVSVVPVNTPLLVEATVLNKDIGFIKKNMPVSLKLDTFDFQKYGIINGTVKQIAKDSTAHEKLGEVYKVYIIPKENQLMVDGKPQYLSTGLSLTSEIKVGKRKIIEFFIYPIIKHLDEGMSVR